MTYLPEDVGGLNGYEEFCKDLKAQKAGKGNPEWARWHPDYNPTVFDLEAINARIAKLR